jgi:hypothetical protein
MGLAKNRLSWNAWKTYSQTRAKMKWLEKRVGEAGKTLSLLSKPARSHGLPRVEVEKSSK